MRDWKVLRESEIAAITRYDNWVTSRTAELPPWRPGKRYALVPSVEAGKRRGARESLLQAAKQQFPQLFAWFDNQLGASRAQPSAARRALAHDRVLGPFLEEAEPKGVELGWEELERAEANRHGKSSKASKLRRILEHGMKRELLFLDRAPDEVRVKAIAEAEFDRELALRALGEPDDAGPGSQKVTPKPTPNVRGRDRAASCSMLPGFRKPRSLSRF